MKRKRPDVKDGSIAPEWQSRFFEMWERSIEEDNARYERSAEMFREDGANQCHSCWIQRYFQRFSVKIIIYNYYKKL